MERWSEDERMYAVLMMDRNLRKYHRGNFEYREVMYLADAFIEGVENGSIGQISVLLKKGIICLSEAIDVYVHNRSRKELLKTI